MYDFEEALTEPQYPKEARTDYELARYAYRDARPVLLDEARTARLLARTSGRRISPLYRNDVKRVQRDMVLERAIYWRVRRTCTGEKCHD